jgi:hypothetical protein
VIGATERVSGRVPIVGIDKKVGGEEIHVGNIKHMDEPSWGQVLHLVLPCQR